MYGYMCIMVCIMLVVRSPYVAFLAVAFSWRLGLPYYQVCNHAVPSYAEGEKGEIGVHIHICIYIYTYIYLYICIWQRPINS